MSDNITCLVWRSTCINNTLAQYFLKNELAKVPAIQLSTIKLGNCTFDQLLLKGEEINHAFEVVFNISCPAFYVCNENDEETTKALIRKSVESKVEFRILRVNFSNHVETPLALLKYFSGVGKIVSTKLVTSKSYVETFLLYPNGVTRLKTSGQLELIRSKERQERFEKAKKDASSGKKKRKRVSAATEFKDFLLNEFGRSFMSQGSGVLDIAGGQGELSFKLETLSQIPSTIVDPRPRTFAAFKYLTKDLILRRTGVGKSPILEINCPSHLHCWFHYSKANNLTSDSIERILVSESDNKYVDEVLIDSYESNKSDSSKLKELLQTCSIIVGLHPDQATEYIVDYCLDHGKAFAIIPCCVFNKSSLFSHRANIKTYEAFIEYLEQKSPKIQRKTLNFVGRNICLFFKGYN